LGLKDKERAIHNRGCINLIFKNKNQGENRVSHFVSLNGIGGVQKNFTEYIESSSSNFKHTVYTLGEIDSQYHSHIKALDIRNIFNLIRLIADIISKYTIVHFYNNLSSSKVAIFLLFIPSRKLIIHERGTAWNHPSKFGFITRFNAYKADLILSNSKASKAILIEKFHIPKGKITVINNGINTLNVINSNIQKRELKNDFSVGFVGRIDSPKGIHVLIDAIKNPKLSNINLKIAGDGPLFKTSKKQADNYKNITFLGRINDLHSFFNQINLLVVPSIREPFGNVCLEAGLHKVPVLATNVDGIPEIIKHGVSGELMTPTEIVHLEASADMVPLPECVVNPKTQKLQLPLQLNHFKLAEKILELSQDAQRLDHYSTELYNTVVSKFSMSKFSKELDNIYLGLMGEK